MLCPFCFGGVIISTKQITIKFTEEDAEKLAKLAKENNLSISEQVRKLVKKGITLNAFQNDEEVILSHMKAALKSVLDPQIERMVKINVKNSIASSINLLYTAFLMYQTARPESRIRLEPIMDEARRLGISFVQLAKGSIDDFIKTSTEKINVMWDDM